MPETGVYEIARFIPLKARRQMVAVKYRKSSDGRVCADGKCPMGWLPGIDVDMPGGMTIANWVMRRGLHPKNRPDSQGLFRLAYQFTDDWDDGAIKDLHKALGVPR